MAEMLSVVRQGPRWAVQHNGSFIGFAQTLEDAVQTAQNLSRCLQEEGRKAEVGFEPRSWQPRSAA